MQKLILLLSFLCLQFFASAQMFSLTVSNGYGSGNYSVGDTVDIWSAAIPITSSFDKWTGNVATVESIDEWHTTLVMPAQNISVSANLKTIGSITINYEKIMGRDTLKNVYSYFPPNFKGVIFCFHGTGGAASNWVNSFEYRQFLNDAIADTFAFIITEAEEITKQTDFNLDGKLRWAAYPIDTINNVDYVNIKLLRDTFSLRGITNQATRYYAVGMSNGGNFAPAVATAFSWRAAVSYCAQSAQGLVSQTTVPIQWCMAKYDNNENVGSQGNAAAAANYNTLLSRGICTKYFSHDRSPLYAERFMRSGTINQTIANNLLVEFRSNQLIDSNNYLLFASDSIAAKITANPSAYPVFLSMNGLQRAFAASQVDVMYAAHQFYSDYNKRTLHFFDFLCDSMSVPSSILDIEGVVVSLFPNPFSTQLTFSLADNDQTAISFYNFLGQQVLQQTLTNSTTINTEQLADGIYFYEVRNAKGTLKTGKLVKQ